VTPLRECRQRGFGWLQIIGVLLAAAFLVGAIYKLVNYVGEWIEARDAAIFAAGEHKARAEYEARDNEKLIQATARIRELEAAARKEEARRAHAVSSAVATHIKEKNDAHRNLEILRAALHDGSLLLRDPAAEAGAGCPGSGERGGGRAAADPAGSAGRDGGGELPRAAAGVLSGRASDFLLTEAGRADAALGKLRLCRATLKAERSGRPSP
jgi:hypothetical protein